MEISTTNPLAQLDDYMLNNQRWGGGENSARFQKIWNFPTVSDPPGLLLAKLFLLTICVSTLSSQEISELFGLQKKKTITGSKKEGSFG